MATFIAIEYDDQHKAHEVRLALARLQKEYLIDLEDAVVAVKDANGKVKLHQAVNMTAAGASRGGLWGTLVGVLFFGPFFGTRSAGRRNVHHGSVRCLCSSVSL